uniref:BTB domain-containing protein n=1 Tax=Leersia perrieri TaxID=77586 RepID=A0A0D9X5K7_9ORYZ
MGRRCGGVGRATGGRLFSGKEAYISDIFHMETAPNLVSTCTAPVFRGQHSFVVSDYSLNMGLGPGEFIRSKMFNIGGFDWSIRYYPDGVNHRCRRYIAVFLELMTQGAKEASTSQIYGWEKFIERTTLDASPALLLLDRITIVCDIIVLKDGPLVSGVVLPPPTKVPPSALSSDFEKLLESKEGADITFVVKGESFPVHKVVLIARSPILKALLCGSMTESGASHITVEEMEPVVFKALLHFIYTDSLMPFDNCDEDKLVPHLLRAADRYGMERLKAICEVKLCMNIDVERVITIFVLADQHQCNMLKRACLNFLATPNTLEKVIKTPEYDELKNLDPRNFPQTEDGRFFVAMRMLWWEILFRLTFPPLHFPHIAGMPRLGLPA